MTPSKEQIEAWLQAAGDAADRDMKTAGVLTDYWTNYRNNHLATLAYAAGYRAGMEEAAKICEGIAKECSGVVVGPFATDFGKVLHEAQAVGALNSASAIRAAMEVK